MLKTRVTPSVMPLGCLIWNRLKVLPNVPWSYLIPVSSCFDLYGANTWPTLAEPIGASGPCDKPWMELANSEKFGLRFTTRPSTGEVAILR